MLFLSVALLGLAQAASADVLPKGSGVWYVGLGASSFKSLAGGSGTSYTLDRQLTARAEGLFMMGVGGRLDLGAYLPLVHARAWDSNPKGGPCDGAMCETVNTVGRAGLQARYQVLRGPISANVSGAVVSDIWNMGTRNLYTAPGPATVDLCPGATLTARRSFGHTQAQLNVAMNAVLRRGRETDALPRAPGQELGGLVELKIKPPGPVALTLDGSTG